MAEPETLDWLNQQTIEAALFEGHVTKSSVKLTPAVSEWLERLELAAHAAGRAIMFSGSYLAEYGILDVSIVTESEYAISNKHPNWTYRRVQRVAHRRARFGGLFRSRLFNR